MKNEPKEGKINEGRLKTYASYALLTLIFFIDCFLSLDFFGGIPYIIGLVLVMWLLPPKEMVRFGFVCGVVALLGFFSPPAEIEDNMSGLMSRFMAIFTVIAIAILARRESDIEEKYIEEKKLLNSVVEKRTNGLKQVVDQFDEVKIRLSEAEQLGHFGFWEYYPSNQQMIWSNGMFNIYGYPISPQAPSFHEFLNLTHVDDIELLQNSIESTLKDKKPSAVEYRVIMPDGSFKWLYYKGRPVINHDGHIENIVGTIQDITLLKQSAHQTDINTAKYNTLFQSASIPKALFIPDKRILEVNTAFCKWVGYHEKELLKIPIEKLMHKDDRSMDDAYARDIIQGDLDVYRKEKRFVRKNGQIAWGIINIAAVLDSSSNKVMFFSAEIVDTTRLKAAESARKKAEEAWREAEETVTELEAEKRISATQDGDSGSQPAMMPAEFEEELEKAYGMAEEVIDHVFEVSTDKLAIIGEDGLYKRVSPQLGRFLGSHPNQLEEQPVLNQLHPDDHSTYRAYERRLFSGRPVGTIKVRKKDTSGTFVWLSIESTFNRDHQVAYVQFQETDPPLAQQDVRSPEAQPKSTASKPLVEEDLVPVQKSTPAPAFIEAEESNLVEREHEPEPQTLLQKPPPQIIDDEESSYPSIEDHLAQLYGEVDPSKVVFNDEPAAQQPVQEETTSRIEATRDFVAEDEAAEIFNASQPLQQNHVAEPTGDLPPPIENVQDNASSSSVHDEGFSLYTPTPSTESQGAIESGLERHEDHLKQEKPPLQANPSEPALDQPVTASGVIPPPYEKKPGVEALTEPLDHLYYDDEEPEAPAGAPERTYSDIHWRQLTDKMPFVAWMLDEQRNCKYVNKKLRSFTGLPFEQLEGTGWSKTIHPEDYRKYVKYANAIVKEYKPVGFAYRIRRADGIYRWMQETSIPVFDKSNRFEGYLATSLDISKLKRVGAHFAKALESAINLEDIHSSLVQCFSEEAILAISDSIKVADALINNSQEMPQRELSKLMRLAGQRMLSLVNGMLAFSNIKPKQPDFVLREIDIRNVISTTIDMITPLRRKEGPRFQLDTKSEPLHIMADKVLLHRSLENLIRGLQDTAESRMITIDFTKQIDYGVISIAHIGPILTDSFMAELSDLYRDSKQLSLYQRKSGLHLSLIKKLCELMGGSLQIHYQEDIGPIISIKLKLANAEMHLSQASPEEVSGIQEMARPEPVNGEHHTRSARPALARRVNPESPSRIHQQDYSGAHQQLAEVAEAITTLSPKEPRPAQESYKPNGSEQAESAPASRQRILIGEHNRDTQRLIRSLLQPYYDLSIVPDIKAFLKQANEASFDLFLLDIHMRSDEGHHGVDILRELRKMPQYRRTPVIAVASGNSGADKNELIERAGFNDFLRKPYSIVELLDTVEKVIES